MALEGSLFDMSLSDLFQIFRSGPKSGVLILSRSPERGVIYVFQGKLIDAVLMKGSDNQVDSSGEDAVLQLLQWDDAAFVFRHDLSVSERPVRIVHDSEWLVMEAIRRGETPALMPAYEKITLDSRLELASMPTNAESGVNLDLNQWRVLSQIAICDTLSEICARTGLTPDEGIRFVGQLVAIGLVEVAPPKASIPVPKPTASRQRLSDLVAPQPQSLAPAYAGAAPAPSGRGLLGAIMRRVRGL